jgi:endoglucanase
MHEIKTFRPCGFNLGGWLSQSPLTLEHAGAFIGPDDFRRIASWKFNSVRLPVDASWLWGPDGRGNLDPGRWAFLERVFRWAWDAGLLVLFDLHQCAWHSFAKKDEATLWDDPAALSAFAAQWEELAGRLRGAEGPLWAEVLNEPTAKDPEVWNHVAAELVRASRRGNPSLPLIVESTEWGSLRHLEALAGRLSGDGILLSFHYYEPMLFTHQRAPWWKVGSFYRDIVDYPGEPPRWRELLANGDLSCAERGLITRNGRFWDREAHRQSMEPAFALAQKGVPLYCGEFGVYEKVSRASRLAWTRDVVSLLKEMGAGWSYWNYKQLDFGVVGKAPEGNPEPVDMEMVSLLQEGL